VPWYSNCNAGDLGGGRLWLSICHSPLGAITPLVVIKTVINRMTFDGSTADPMQQAVRDALIAFMAATAQAQAEAAKSAQRAGIDHKRRAAPNAYLGRKPSYDRATLDRVLSALSNASAPSLSTIARAEGLTKQTVHRIKADPQAAEAALVAWGL
jgi:putative DNA-invertase from lambdoid prophage Rac